MIISCHGNLFFKVVWFHIILICDYMYVTINVVLHVALFNFTEHCRRVMLLRSSG